jgi:hypothetical protein
MAERVKAEDAEKIKNLIKNLRDESELYEWLIHTKKQIARVEHLRVANDLLEVVVGDHIMNETMKRYFMRGNKKGEGIEALEKYLEKDEVKGNLKKIERAYVQLDKVSNNKIPLIEYVERKKVLLLASNKSYRDDEVVNCAEIITLIKGDMSAEDIELLGVMTKYENMDAFIEACETFTAFKKQKKEEEIIVASMRVGEEKKEERKEKKFEGECFICHKIGHKANKCWSKKGKEGGKQETKEDWAARRRCFYCNQLGHVIADCPKSMK